MTTRLPKTGAVMGDDAQSGVDRRQFLKVLGVTGAGAAALGGCSTDRVAKLVPYMVQSEDQVPGVPTFYASTCTECSTGCGLVVKTREGRPIKLEGNPEHPVNAGALCSRGQAGLQGLYNPDRIGTPLARNAAGGFDAITWDDAIARLAAKVPGAQGRLAVINGYGAGTFSALVDQWTSAVGGRAVRYEPYAREVERLAAERTWGRSELPSHDFAAARYIVSFGADFLETWGPTIEHQRGFAMSHGFADGQMAKHVFVGPRMSLTAANADEWVSVPAGTETLVAFAMASHLGSTASSHTPDSVGTATGIDPATIRTMAEEFRSMSPSLAVAGGVPGQHRGAIDLCHAVNLLNEAAGNVGRTVTFTAAPIGSDGYSATQALFADMASGNVAMVIVHEANPLFTMPKSGKFAEALAKVPFKVSTAQVMDETAAACDLVLPNLHGLERWDDLQPRSGLIGLLQPTVQPVFAAMHTGDVLLATARKVGGALSAAFTATTFEEHLKAAWGNDPEAWREALAVGGNFSGAVPGADASTAIAAVPDSARAPASAPAPAPAPATATAPSPDVLVGVPTFDGDGEFVFLPYPSSMYYDGRGANKPWLLENPDPMTKITWQSWVELHPDTARRIDVREGEIVEVTSPHGSLRAQVYVYPGVRPDTVAMPIGLGHTQYGRYAKDRGANPLDLLGAANGQGFLPYVATRVSLSRTGDYHKVAKTEGTPRQLGRGIIEAMAFTHAAAGMTPEEAYRAGGHTTHEINPPRELAAIDGWYEGQVERWKLGEYGIEHAKWGMAIDLSRCTGCSACVTACYAENNIPTVGEEQIFKGREMSWMRIERYWEGGDDGEPIEARFIPMLCQHCDNAPCEPVCPVYAAYHTPDGLNGQVYNRCVGTRYCSNNCPYKVRYFNWLKYNETAWPSPLNLQLNPEVTTRARGVMEKCTFCVQRIRGAQGRARLEDRPLKDGDIMPACAQACPSRAIAFGNVRDPAATVVGWKRNPRGYQVLEDTNVQSVITYLARVIHRDPEQPAAASDSGGGH